MNNIEMIIQYLTYYTIFSSFYQNLLNLTP